MADFSKFRSSIGGFNRSDVVDYIESVSVEHKKELRRLKDANEKLEAEKAALQAELDQTRHTLDAANDELSAAKAELSRMQEEDASLQQQIESLAQEASELSQRALDAEAKVDAYAQQPVPSQAVAAEDAPVEEETDTEPSEDNSVSSLAQQELEAYRRAEATERNALARAARLREKLSQLCDHAHSRYTETGEDLAALSQDLSSVLDRMRDTLADLQVAFDETENAFETLQDAD